MVPDDLPSNILDTVMHSKSQRKTYKVREVVGKTVGRVQYFLNTVVSQLKNDGSISDVKG